MSESINSFENELFHNRLFSYPAKESGSNGILIICRLSNVHNSESGSNATQSNFLYKNV